MARTRSDNSSTASQDSGLAASSKTPAAKAPDTVHVSGLAGFLAGILHIAAILAAVLLDGKVSDGALVGIVVALILAGLYLLFSLKVARQWEKAVVLHLGKYKGLRGPGMFWIVPIVETPRPGSITA